MTDEKLVAAILSHAEEEYPRECCGVLLSINGDEVYRPCKNVKRQGTAENDGPEFGFIIDPMDMADAEDDGEIIAIVHSHPDAGAHPSHHDTEQCNAGDIDWIIASWPDGDIYRFSPDKNPPYEGRKFILGKADCWSIIRDWYKRELGVELHNYSVDREWWRSGENLYMDNWKDAGFDQVKGEIERGDVVIMTIGSSVPNHGAVCIGDGMILHHMMGRKSRIVQYNDYYKERTAMICRKSEIGKQENPDNPVR